VNAAIEGEPYGGCANPDDPRVVRSRAAVLDAALELLCEGGYAAVTIDGVARRSGVARTTIYRHWSSLAALVIDAVVSSHPGGPPERLGDPRQDFRRHLGSLAEKLTTTPFGPALAATLHAARCNDEVARLQNELVSGRRTSGLAILRDAQADGLIDPGLDPEVLLDQATGAVFFRYLISHQPLDDAYLDQLVESAFRAAAST
jgi:TetR/AcrR family transcriptional regulator of autoinduction and epiphytic fitness